MLAIDTRCALVGGERKESKRPRRHCAYACTGRRLCVQIHGGAADAGSCALSVSIDGDFSLVPRQPMHCRDLVRTRAWTVALEWKEELAKQVLRNFTLIKMAMHESEGLRVSVCHCASYRRMELITRNAPCTTYTVLCCKNKGGSSKASIQAEMAKAYGLFQGVQYLHISYVRVLYYTLFPVKRMRGCYGVILPAGYWFDRHDWPDLLKGFGLFSLFF